MKRAWYLLILAIALLTGCQDETEREIFQETGIVLDYAGAGNCRFVIELDNGNKIQPMHFPEGFVFAQGQRVMVEYVELSDVISTCDRGVATDIRYIEELNCAPYVDLYFENYDSLARDPVYIHEVFLDGDCLQIKLSYSGGCREHTVDLARMHPWFPMGPGIPAFEIRHNANNDLCEAYFTKELRFDLSSLRNEGIKEFVLYAKLPDGKVYNKVFDL